MRSRHLLNGVLLLSCILACWYMFGLERVSPSSRSPLRAVSLGPGLTTRILRDTSAATAIRADLTDAIGNNLIYVSRLVSTDKELIIYAGAAFFGLFMMVLAIKNSAPVGPRTAEGRKVKSRESCTIEIRISKPSFARIAHSACGYHRVHRMSH
jgi:hypothetical protein